MTQLTATINAIGVTAAQEWPGGDGNASVTGDVEGAIITLEYATVGERFESTGGRVFKSGGFNFTLPACKVRWRADTLSKTAINCSAALTSIE